MGPGVLRAELSSRQNRLECWWSAGAFRTMFRLRDVGFGVHARPAGGGEGGEAGGEEGEGGGFRDGLIGDGLGVEARAGGCGGGVDELGVDRTGVCGAEDGEAEVVDVGDDATDTRCGAADYDPVCRHDVGVGDGPGGDVQILDGEAASAVGDVCGGIVGNSEGTLDRAGGDEDGVSDDGEVAGGDVEGSGDEGGLGGGGGQERGEEEGRGGETDGAHGTGFRERTAANGGISIACGRCPATTLLESRPCLPVAGVARCGVCRHEGAPGGGFGDGKRE